MPAAAKAGDTSGKDVFGSSTRRYNPKRFVMGEFRRQPSKVWWSNCDDENFSDYLGWGKSMDLSGDLISEEYNNLTASKNNLNSSKTNKSEMAILETTSCGGLAAEGEDATKKDNQDEEETERKSLENDRGSSSSPSQRSHKSQDSGFSDSEIQNNALSLSPQCSPEMSARTSCIKCKSREEIESEEMEKSHNEAVVNYRKLKTSIKTTVQYRVDRVGFGEEEKKFLETAFPKAKPKEKEAKDELTGSEVSKFQSSPKSQGIVSNSRTKSGEKINQIQNQLELSFKLPKRINLPQNLKISNLFHAAKSSESRVAIPSAGIKSKPISTESISAFKFLSGARPNGTDREGFKVPKPPADQSFFSFNCRGSNPSLDFAEFERNLPVSSSTPKSGKFQSRRSPGAGVARAAEKKTTFATVRKLKGISERKLKGPKALLESFNRCTSTGSFLDKHKINLDFESSVKQWLTELETMYEAEVMTTLQSKSLATDLTRQVTNMADATSYTVKKLHQRTKIISLEFSKLFKQNKNKIDKNIGPLVQSLVGHITEFINEYVQKSNLVSSNDQSSDEKSQKSVPEEESENGHEMITDFRKPEPKTLFVPVEMKRKEEVREKTKEEQVLEACENLRKISSQPQCDHEKIEMEVSELGQKFREVVDSLLENHIQALVRVLEEPRTELALRTALSALTTLGLEGDRMSLAVSRCGGIRALLAICLEARATAVRVSALRALATVCCVGDTIRQFEQAGGVEIVADILADERRSESELSEASAVIAQITAPWVQDNHSVNGLSQFLNSLVTSLTRIVSRYQSCETLLLSSAALANLTFMEPRTVWPLLENQTAKKLLSAVRRQGSKVSVFIQEQAATIVANMSSVPECRKQLAEERAVVALLCFLETHHSPLQIAPEVAAGERVLQKSAIALSRLCSDVVVAKQVVELQGVNRLVRLCREEKERNHSDGVLVACLAALRKIVANCGTEALEELNAMELVEPRLLDSFLLYSSKQESCV